MVRHNATLIWLAIACAYGAATARGDIVFDLGDVPVGTVTPFSDTQGGLTASFSSPDDPFGFEVVPAGFPATFAPPITGNSLTNDSVATPLVISFSKPVSGITLDFGTIDAAAVTLEAFVGGLAGTMVASTSATGAVSAGYTFPQGSIGLTGSPMFDTVELLYDEYIVAANFDVSETAIVPEPSTFLSAITGVLILGAYIARRRAAGIIH